RVYGWAHSRGSSTGGAERLVALLEQIVVWVVDPTSRQDDELVTVEALEGVLKRGPVVLAENVGPDLDLIVGPDAEDVGVERPVVDRAHGDPIRNDRLAALRIGPDVRSVQQFTAAKPAQGALGLIGEEHTVAEDALVQPGAH